MRPGREEGEDIRTSGLLTLPHFTPNEKNPRRTGDEPGGPEAEPPGAITLARFQYVNRTTSSTMRGAEKVFWTRPNVAGFEMSAEPACIAKFGWLRTLKASILSVR